MLVFRVRWLERRLDPGCDDAAPERISALHLGCVLFSELFVVVFLELFVVGSDPRRDWLRPK